jgi:hypothetical protein
MTILSPEPPLLRIEPFKGINTSVSPTQIADNQSPDMLNIIIGEDGELNKRTGYERLFPTSLGVGKITGMYNYRKVNGSEYFLFTHNESLYVMDGDTPTLLFAGLNTGNETSFFTIGDICYIMDGMNIKAFDGIDLTYPDQYIPTLSISKEPAGGGTAYEDFNLLGSGFKDSFSADGVAKDFFLSLKELDDTPVVAVVNGVVIVEGAGLTVDRITGKVTFTTAPTKGTNNVIITAHKTYMEHLFFIRKCQFHTIYGGANDTRVFIGGNPDYPNYVWRSGLHDPTYFPENGFYTFPQEVKGFAKQYDSLIVELESSKYLISFMLNNGEPSFPSKPINDQIGTLATKSIQIIENNPVSLSKHGVYMLTSTNVRDERNVNHLSKNVDQKLLKESNLENAISIDYDKKYWLGINSKVYLFDYAVGEWFIFDSIPASCFLEKDGFLYFGSSSEGLIYRFKKTTELYPFNDDEQPITAYWLSKTFSFGADERRKVVEKVFFNLRPAIRTSAELYYISDKRTRKFVKLTRKDLYHYSYFDYSKMCYGTNEFPQEANNKIKAKKIVYFQLELRNDELNEGFGVLSMGIKFNYQGYVK